MSRLPPNRALGARATIDKRLTINPWTKQRVCASFKANMKQKFIDEKLTVEDLLANRKLYEEMCCQLPPEMDRGHKNGRCRKHGNRSGAPVTSGKYTRHFQALTIEELKQIQDNRSLDPELAVMSGLIKDKLDSINKDISPLATQELKKLATGLNKALDNFDVQGMKNLTEKIISHCDEGIKADTARRDVERMLKTYSDIMNVALKERAMSSEYVHQQDVFQNYLAVYSIVVNIAGLEGAKLNEARFKVEEFILGGAKQNIHPTGQQLVDDAGLQNPDGESGINILPPE